jgi:hypothetical protein
VIDEAEIIAIVNKLIDEYRNELLVLGKDIEQLQRQVQGIGERVTRICSAASTTASASRVTSTPTTMPTT